MNVKKFDAKTAFLYGDLQEEIYMNQPKGFSDHTDKVWRLRKSLYGLKQSSRCWNKKFSYFLQKFSLKTIDAGQCVFCKVNGNEKIIVALFVDDGMIASTSNELTEKLLTYLKNEFKITITNFKLFMGLQIHKMKNGSLFINQENFANKILNKFHMENCKPVKTPTDIHHSLCEDDYSPSTFTKMEEYP